MLARGTASATGCCVYGRAAAYSLVFLAGCTLGVSDLEDRVPPDAAPRAAAPDATPSDEGAVPADAAPAPSADAALAQTQSCDEQFGAATGYVLCGEDSTTCTFFAQTGGGTCADQCALFASECLDGFDSDVGATCTATSESGCLAALGTQTCTCARADAAGVGGSGR